MKRNLQHKIRVFLNTYGLVKSRGPMKSWGSLGYLGYFGPYMFKIGPNDQTQKKRPKEPNKTTFPHHLRLWIRIFHKILKFLFQRVKKGQFWSKLDLIWTSMTNLPQQSNKATFPHGLKPCKRIVWNTYCRGSKKVTFGPNWTGAYIKAGTSQNKVDKY